VESVINPMDCAALAGALELRRREGGQITVMTMGPPQSEAALREALAAGADRAVLLSDPRFAGADTLATSHVLAAAVSRMDPVPDVILCGMQTSDSDTGHVGPQIAEELDWPQVCGVTEIHAEGDGFVVKRLSDGFVETLRVAPPVVFTAALDLAEVESIALGALERAFTSGDILHWDADALDLNETDVGLAGSATRVWRLHPPPPLREGEVVAGPPEVLLDRLIRRLEALSILDEEDGSNG
jgi:electron transfer flavoprotein beta subunit